MNNIPLRVVVEDVLSQEVLKHLLKTFGDKFHTVAIDNRGGITKIKANFQAFNNASKTCPFIILVDLDKVDCPIALRQDWFRDGQPNPNMIFRIAVREIESWLLGDAEAFAAFIGIHPSNIPIAVDELADPKQTLLNLVRRSNRKSLKEALLPRIGSTASIGREYNDVLSDYVERHWRPAVARESSRSLDKAIHALSVFKPQWN